MVKVLKIIKMKIKEMGHNIFRFKITWYSNTVKSAMITSKIRNRYGPMPYASGSIAMMKAAIGRIRSRQDGW